MIMDHTAELRSLKATIPIGLCLNDADRPRIPVFGLGCFQVKGSDVIQTAIEQGYRLFDTATRYGNEEEVGQALRKSGLQRNEYFVTTKLWNSDHGYEKTKVAFHNSLNKLGLKYIDLYLIHQPKGGKIVETWRAMNELKKSGLVRSIGVSNFNTYHLEELNKLHDREGLALPSVNQIELHPWLQQREVVESCRRYGIKLMGYCPLARGVRFREGQSPDLEMIASEHNKTKAQILIRWSLQKGYITIPKSSHPERIIENSTVFDFELSLKDMKVLDSLEEGLRVSSDSIYAPWEG